MLSEHRCAIRFLTQATQVACFGGIKVTTFFLCPREESNLDHELRKLASYPLNDGGNDECISESEPRRHQINESVFMFTFVDVLKKIRIDHICINTRKRNYQVRRKPILSFYRKHGRKFVFYIFKDGERNHVLEDMDFIPDNDALFHKLEAM